MCVCEVIRTRRAVSLDADSGILDDFAPLRQLRADKRGELIGCFTADVSAGTDHLIPDRAIIQGLHHLPVQEIDYRLRHAGRRADAVPSGRFHARQTPLGTGPLQYIEMIKVTTGWMRPQHLRFGPNTYLRLDHPLDVHRRGIGWIGWVPFALTAADVPEAVLVQQVNGGTIIMTWPDFWQAHPGARNEEAVRRTQDVEVRLNLLGVLPTTQDLASGNWGQ